MCQDSCSTGSHDIAHDLPQLATAWPHGLTAWGPISFFCHRWGMPFFDFPQGTGQAQDRTGHRLTGHRATGQHRATGSPTGPRMGHGFHPSFLPSFHTAYIDSILFHHIFHHITYWIDMYMYYYSIYIYNTYSYAHWIIYCICSLFLL